MASVISLQDFLTDLVEVHPFLEHSMTLYQCFMDIVYTMMGHALHSRAKFWGISIRKVLCSTGLSSES